MPHTPTVTTLVPAHNEAAGIGPTLASVAGQVDRLIVVADNCTDGTERVAAGYGCDVHVTVGNTEKKAGALNQVLDGLLPTLDGDDVILVVDADSVLDDRFVPRGLAAYTGTVGGVGGVFRGRVDADTAAGRMLQRLQSNEYARYELDIRRRKGKVLVLTGTATLLRVSVLRQVVEARRTGQLPGAPQVYDTTVLTEDSELSLALRTLGYTIISPAGCTLTTETMPTMAALRGQRARWKRGALENLCDYGWTAVTRPYWGRQALAAAGLVVTATYLTALSLGALYGITIAAFWIAVTALFVLERVVTVRRRGPAMMALAGLLVVELVYDLFLQTVQFRAFVAAALRTERAW